MPTRSTALCKLLKFCPCIDGFTCSAETKLLFLIRHGQAWSNYLEEVLGPDLWYGVVSKCGFTTGNGTDYQIFDAGEPASLGVIVAPFKRSTSAMPSCSRAGHQLAMRFRTCVLSLQN